MPMTKASAIKYDMYNDRHKLFFLKIHSIYYIIIQILKRCFITFTDHDWCILFCLTGQRKEERDFCPSLYILQ